MDRRSELFFIALLIVWVLAVIAGGVLLALAR
jgi:hypothetical protein